MTSHLIPISFFGYDTLIYIASAFIGFMIAYKAYRIYDISEKKTHFYLFSAFTILSLGFLIIALTSAFTYLNYSQTGEYPYFSPVFGVDDLGYWIYLGSSLVAYLLLSLMYLGEKKAFLVTLPLTVNYFTYFNVVLFFFIAFIAFRSATNYFSKKTKESLLVMSSFSLIALYHLLLFFTPYSRVIYVLAHASLILGFVSLLLMLRRVGK